MLNAEVELPTQGGREGGRNGGREGNFRMPSSDREGERKGGIMYSGYFDFMDIGCCGYEVHGAFRSI